MAVRPLVQVPDDPQREAYYRAEREFTPRTRYSASLTRRQAERVIEQVRRMYRLPPVELKTARFPTSWRAAWVEQFDDDSFSVTINTPVTRTTLITLLHEMAHIVVAHCYGDGPADHGSEYVGVAMYLYHHYRVIPPDAFRTIMARYKIKLHGFAESSPSALAAVRKRRMKK